MSKAPRVYEGCESRATSAHFVVIRMCPVPSKLLCFVLKLHIAYSENVELQDAPCIRYPTFHSCACHCSGSALLACKHTAIIVS